MDFPPQHSSISESFIGLIKSDVPQFHARWAWNLNQQLMNIQFHAHWA
jgi:hypothetical protein